MRTKNISKRKAPKTPEEFHALGAQLDREAKALNPHRPRGFVFKARTWEDLERWETQRFIDQARRIRGE
jgi:hypothetical protein